MDLVRFWLFRQLYSFLCWIILPLVFLRLWLKAKKLSAYRDRWSERIAGYSTEFKIKNKINQPLVWLHAVSVGELLAAVPLIKALEQTYPKHAILITTMTPTGSERVLQAFKEKLNKTIFHVYLPYDLPHLTNRFLSYFKPVLCLVMETEIWPNLFWGIIQREIPICIVNARLSPRSFDAYLKLKNWAKPLFSKIKVLTQSEADLVAYRELGVLLEHSDNMGNIKFDAEIPKNIAADSQALRKNFLGQPIWIAASTHEKEEEMVLMAFKTLKKHFKDLLLVLVPRHPNRFEEVAHLCSEAGWHVARRSQEKVMPASSGFSSGSSSHRLDIYLGDTMGELLLLYAISDIAFVGGSLVPVGGHNLLEPALFSVPVLTGKALHNFKQISTLLIEAGHTQLVDSAEDLTEKVAELLNNKDHRLQKGQAGKSVLDQHRGALGKLIDFVRQKRLIQA